MTKQRMFLTKLLKHAFFGHITAVCVLFLLKLKWPKNKSFYDFSVTRAHYSLQRMLCVILVDSLSGKNKLLLFPLVDTINYSISDNNADGET